LVLQKHNIDLFDASAVFFDPFFLSDYDAGHSVTEDRYMFFLMEAHKESQHA